MTMDEIKEWRTMSSKRTIMSILVLDGVSFCYDAEMGELIFTAPESYIERIKYKVVNNYCLKSPIINEVKA